MFPYWYLQVTTSFQVLLYKGRKPFSVKLLTGMLFEVYRPLFTLSAYSSESHTCDPSLAVSAPPSLPEKARNAFLASLRASESDKDI